MAATRPVLCILLIGCALGGVLAAVTGEHSSGGKDEVQNLMSQFNLTQDEVAEYKEAFMLYDKDDNGKITKAEICVVKRSLRQNPTDTDLTNIMTEWDLDGNGTIELNEFIKMMVKKNKEPLKESELMELFQMFDKDGNGFISSQELLEVMTVLGEEMTEEDAKKMINEGDSNEDGFLDYNEFVKIQTAKNETID